MQIVKTAMDLQVLRYTGNVLKDYVALAELFNACRGISLV